MKILGIIWDIKADEFQFYFQGIIGYIQSLSPSKQSVLKLPAKIFDPLGMLSPFTIGMKMLFQKICIEKTDWEQTLDGELLIRWNYLIKELTALVKIKVPWCCYVGTATPISHQLHGFSDASEHAFAAVIYLRTVYNDGSISVRLLASKTRVAPIKKQTIPRLELLGANILARLFNTIQKILKSLPQVTGYCWTDSYTVLCWIKNPGPWKQYVQHRIKELHKLTDKNSWRFCPGSQNPADLPSRSCKGQELVDKKVWWNGPEFLTEPSEIWPDMPTKLNTELAVTERMQKPPVISITHSLVRSQNSHECCLNIETIMDVSVNDMKGSHILHL